MRIDYIIPARGLIGFRNDFLTMTRGSGLLHHIFDHYGPRLSFNLGQRSNGVLLANGSGQSNAFALWNLQARGQLLIGPKTAVYEGMVVGKHARGNDLVVNVSKGKQLTNMRAAGTDENIVLTPPLQLTLEQALEFINDDELVEVTPSHIRLRKKHLKEHERKRSKK